MATMGDGARSLSLVGVCMRQPREAMMRICCLVEEVARRHGYEISMTPAHLACLACEVHRRGTYDMRGLCRRAGF